MYAYIDGRLTFKCPTYIVVETGGVGYQINISLNTYAALGSAERCKIYTWLHVKEDAHTLYGFADEGERRLFLHLISVSGIGPTTCRMMLSSITPNEIQQAIVGADVALIQKIKGIGAKSAQRIILELQDKLKKEGIESLISMPNHNTIKDEALSALIMLGFSKQVAEKALDNVMKKSDGDLTVEQMIKQALKNL
ncbi:Holliday junction branch migration protein RuvA [Pedobacter chitinilyticus]|jgi:Holliday junction DNA helicase RuvA|uniref:Holliday junction branch migration complex subunit RuvA n=1 Tax=Pedobacter chitinilyticus TaxID=2233776 RepID=A0A443YNY5_9SPHI|nr:Holliday junction branch migration protein RuvA [Pedobacter chitinilyticus]RWU05502.1 Holliday junction branch migration protein RuvA [Pedobacter chitinilyticus]